MDVIFGMWFMVIINWLFPDLDSKIDKDNIIFLEEIESGELYEDWDAIGE
jgi:hypothetical protein